MDAMLPDRALRQAVSIVFVVLGALDLAVSGMAVYMILRFSPKSFGKYKWIQLTLTLSILYSDVWGVLASAIFIPRVTGAVYVSKFFTHPTALIVSVAMLADGVLLQVAAITLAFYFRIFVLLPERHRRIWSKVHVHIFVFVFTTIHLAPITVYFSAPSNQAELLNRTIAKFPALAELRTFTEPIIIYDTEHYLFWVLKYYLIVMVILFVPSFVYGIASVYLHLHKSKIISPGTRRLQTQLLYSLTWQCTIPIAICVLPYYTIVSSFYNSDSYIPYVTQYADLICCTHSTVNSCLLIFLSKPYRDELLTMIRFSSSTSSTRSTSLFISFRGTPCTIPLAICVLPYYTITSSFYNSDTYIPYVTQYADLICCTHSTVNSCLLIILSKPYRDELLTMMRFTSSTSSTRSTSVFISFRGTPCTIPLAICVLPYYTIASSFYNSDTYLPYVTQYADLICCTHSTVNSCLLIILSKPYRDELLTMMRFTSSTSSTRSTSVFISFRGTPCTIPLAICVLPYYTIASSFYNSDTYLPYVTQYADLICCTHSTVNSCLLIILSKPYRDELLTMMRFTSSTSSTRSTSVFISFRGTPVRKN